MEPSLLWLAARVLHLKRQAADAVGGTAMPDQMINGGIGVLLAGSRGFALLKSQSAGSTTEWLTGGMIWVFVAVYSIGAFTVMAGLRGSEDTELNNFAGLIGRVCGIGASLAAAPFKRKARVPSPRLARAVSANPSRDRGFPDCLDGTERPSA